MSFFIGGTGTDVGKTVIASALMTGAAKEGHELQYWKPVQTGGSAVDAQAMRQLFPETKLSALPSWEFALPASPDQAAAAEGREGPRLADLNAAWQSAATKENDFVVEGAGGLLVPLNEAGENWRDFLRLTQLPIVLVASSALGTLNHTLLSLEALDLVGLSPLAVILNGPLHAANLATLQRLRPAQKFLCFPLLGDLDPADSAWQNACARLWKEIPKRDKALEEPSWLEWDRQHSWHPYTQHLTAPDPTPIVSAQGIYLETAKGERLIDGCASWWTQSVGHGHPAVGAAITKQQSRLDHCLYAGATHEGASTLARRLVELSDGLLSRVFYADNGSCGIEVALKMALQSWQLRGQPERQKFLFFTGAYHGDTFGAMSVGGTQDFHQAFSPYLFSGYKLAPLTDHPSRICPEGPTPKARQSSLLALEAMFRENGHMLAGVIIEPWVQGASGMNLQELSWLRQLGGLCRQYGVPFILDEVFTGLGRLGSMLAYQRIGLEPDIVVLSKGLTGGSMPLAAVLATEELFKHFLSEDSRGALLHGHTYTGHAIACAAALASLDIYKREGLAQKALAMEDIGKEWCEQQGPRWGLQAPRALGALLAFELPGSGTGDYFHPAAQAVPQLARRHGLMLRTLGNTLYLVPPLCITPAQVKEALAGIERILADLERGY